MIPIRDENITHTIPYVNYALIAVNVLVFLMMAFSPNQEGLTYRFALIPAELSSGNAGKAIFNLFSSMFMHGGWMHLIGNMLYLWIFGDNIEDRLGHFAYLAFYLIGGVFAGLTHFLLNPHSPVPTVGACGAIAAVLGAYLIFYPQSRVYTFIPIGYFARLKLLPATLVLGLWFVLQVFNGVGSIGLGDRGGTAYWAHIGGFVFGMLVGLLLKNKKQGTQAAPPVWN